MAKLAAKVRNFDYTRKIRLERTGIEELDLLSQAVEISNQNLLDNTLKMSEIMDLLGLHIGAFEYSPGGYGVQVTKQIFPLMELPCEDENHLYVDEKDVYKRQRLATSFVILGLVPLLAAGTALAGHFRSNMERVVLDDIGRMVSYGGSNTEAVLEECSSLTKHIYDVSTDDGMFLYQILKSPGLGREERKMEITLLLSDFQMCIRDRLYCL